MIGDRVRLVRLQRRMTVDALAARAGVTPRTIYGLDDRKAGPDLDTVERIARALEVEPGWLAWGEPKEGQR